MPREVFNQLSPVQVRNLRDPGRYADGCGLYLVVSETGARWWQWRGTVHGRRREIGMGSARLIELKEAREKARQWRRLSREGGDPAAERDRARRQSLTFEEAARKVWKEQVEPHNRNAKHIWQWLASLESYAFPHLGKIPVHAVTQADVLRSLSPIWMTKPETARRVRQRLKTIFDWSIAEGLREDRNPVDLVEKGLPKQRDRAQHLAALPWRELPALIRRIEAVDGMGALALRFAILTAARSGEVRGAAWDEIDLDAAVWTVPGERMKAGLEHRVPLSAPALAVLEAVLSKRTGLVFPSARATKPLSDMTLAAVLKRLKVPVTVHGFRSTFRDWASEATDTPREIAELALAHQVGNAVERAYARSDLFDRRRVLMDEWARFAGGERD